MNTSYKILRLALITLTVAFSAFYAAMYRAVDFVVANSLIMLSFALIGEIAPARIHTMLSIFITGIGFVFPTFFYFGAVFLTATYRVCFFVRILFFAGFICMAYLGFIVIMPTALIFCAFILITEFIEKDLQILKNEFDEESNAHLDAEHLLKELKYRHKAEIESSKNRIVLEERNRIARTLHDSIGHTVSAAIMQLEAHKSVYLEGEDADARRSEKESVQKSIDTLKAGMIDIRTSIHNLFDQSIDLKTELNKIIEKYSKLSVYLSTPEIIELGAAQKAELVRVVSELFTNVSKHSDAKHIKIIVTKIKSFYAITFKDDGKKIQNNLHEGIGLKNLKQFAEANNGYLEYGYDRGFFVHFRIKSAEGTNDSDN